MTDWKPKPLKAADPNARLYSPDPDEQDRLDAARMVYLTRIVKAEVARVHPNKKKGHKRKGRANYLEPTT